METSDSEYFESADEEFYSDNEEQNKHKQSKNHDDLTAITSKLFPLRLENVKTQLINENVEVKLENNNKLSDNIANTIIPDLEREARYINLQSKSSDKELPLETDVAYDTESEPTIDNSNRCESHNLLNQSSAEMASSTKESSIIFEISNDQHRSEARKQDLSSAAVSNTKDNSPANMDINLWDDDELDWGAEATKEVSQETEIADISKNEDSGWADFDPEWEMDSTSSAKTGKVPDAKNMKTGSPSSDDDDWESLEKPQEKNKGADSWGGWGSWGVSTLLNTATQSVSTLTNQVSQGLSTVLETGIGVPDPEELAKINKIQSERTRTIDEKNEDSQEPTTPVAFGLGNWVSGVSQLTKFVESTGSKVITGGLDTLEAIGKKTVEVLQEGDPGLKKKRALLKLDSGKPNLSEILREAKEMAEEENNEVQQHTKVKRFKNYETLFDDHHGLVHLEALEMLSRLCSIKLTSLNNSLSGEALKDMQETLDQVKELCELPEDEDDNKISVEEAREAINQSVSEIGIHISYDKLFAVCDDTDEWLENLNLKLIDDEELHQQAIETLAQLTSLAVEQFHKAGELLMVKEHRSTADEADSLVQITTTVKALLLEESTKFTEKLSCIETCDRSKLNEHITNIFFEAENSGTYVQDAFHLLLPVLQVGAV